jgi:hypothetical protein
MMRGLVVLSTPAEICMGHEIEFHQVVVLKKKK